MEKVKKIEEYLKGNKEVTVVLQNITIKQVHEKGRLPDASVFTSQFHNSNCVVIPSNKPTSRMIDLND